MTRADYDTVARAIADVKFTQGKSPLLQKVTNSLVIHFGHQNPKFDKAKFLKACGMED